MVWDVGVDIDVCVALVVHVDVGVAVVIHICRGFLLDIGTAAAGVVDTGCVLLSREARLYFRGQAKRFDNSSKVMNDLERELAHREGESLRWKLKGQLQA